MVRNSDEHIDEDANGEEAFDLDEAVSLIDSELNALVPALGIEAVWLTSHSSGGIAIHFDHAPIANTPVSEDLLEARTAYWSGHIADYDDCDAIAASMFEMLRVGLGKEV